MIFRIVKKRGGCCFQEYSKAQKQMVSCGGVSTVKTMKGYVCRTHLSSVVVAEKNPSYYDVNGKEIEYVKDFLCIVDGIKIDESQLEMFQ